MHVCLVSHLLISYRCQKVCFKNVKNDRKMDYIFEYNLILLSLSCFNISKEMKFFEKFKILVKNFWKTIKENDRITLYSIYTLLEYIMTLFMLNVYMYASLVQFLLRLVSNQICIKSSSNNSAVSY